MYQPNFARWMGLGMSMLLCAALGGQQVSLSAAKVRVRLDVSTGTPLRLYIVKRAWYRRGELVDAKFAEPVWAFDRIVIPAGTTASGYISQLTPVPRSVRAMAIVRGDFTPLKQAQVSFTRLILPDGSAMPINAERSLGLATIYVPPRPGKAKPAKDPATRSARLLRVARQQATAQANARSRGLLDLVRSRNKREWVEDFLWEKLPYHPQFYRSGTRFDAVLDDSLHFGEAELAPGTLQKTGAALPTGVSAPVRLTGGVSSADAKVGDPISGVLSEPLFTADHRIALPEGTKLTGKVTMARRARMFHRGGQLRFAFNSVETPTLPSESRQEPEPVLAQISGAEPGTGSVKIDEEGTARATESKARLLRPVLAGLIAAKSIDNDAGRQGASGGANGNLSGRSLGGFSGFGLLGTATSFGPRAIGSAFGFYGLAWSVYSTVVSRGQEVQFEKNSVLAIRFGNPVKGRR